MLNAWFIEKSEKWDLNNYSEQYKLFFEKISKMYIDQKKVIRNI